MNLQINKQRWLIFLLISLSIFSFSHAKETPLILEVLDQFLNSTIRWRMDHRAQFQDSELKITAPIVVTVILCFAAASISSAGGIGGGGLFMPILTIVAGLDLRMASSFSAFMVTGGSFANVACTMFIASKRNSGNKTLIDYDIALLSEPCMLLGVSIGVICNTMFPEWLITTMLAVFLVWSTIKTLKSGMCHWRMESEVMSRNGCQKLENGSSSNGMTDKTEEIPLLQYQEAKCKSAIPWMKLGVLTIIWFSFLLTYLLRGNLYGQGIIHIEDCGMGYWMISASQIPLAIIFTSWILCRRESIHDQQAQTIFSSELRGETENQGPDVLKFPLMAFLAGALGGVFGIGGGMLISPLLLQVGIEPEVTAGTCSFMVFFSSTMSAFQYVLLGMDKIYGAIIFAVVCFVGSLIGLVIVQRAIEKHGRASLIVFAVGLVLALSTVLMTSFGVVDVWRDYTSDKYMGFKLPC